MQASQQCERLAICYVLQDKKLRTQGKYRQRDKEEATWVKKEYSYLSEVWNEEGKREVSIWVHIAVGIDIEEKEKVKESSDTR